MTEIQELRGIVQAQAARVTMLTRLVERMGRELQQHEIEHGWASQWDYTISGQRQYDAAMKRLNDYAEGPPPDAVSEGAWGHE